jgi:hypothetical protein
MNAMYAAATNVIFYMFNCNCAALLRVAIHLIKHTYHKPQTKDGSYSILYTWRSERCNSLAEAEAATPPCRSGCMYAKKKSYETQRLRSL